MFMKPTDPRDPTPALLENGIRRKCLSGLLLEWLLWKLAERLEIGSLRSPLKEFRESDLPFENYQLGYIARLTQEGPER